MTEKQIREIVEKMRIDPKYKRRLLKLALAGNRETLFALRGVSLRQS